MLAKAKSKVTKRFDEFHQMLANIRAMVPENRTWARLRGRNRSTSVHRDPDGTVRLRYHETDIVVCKTNNTVVLNSGGWQTSTTKERINWCLSPYASLYQEKHVWKVAMHGVIVPFEDGMVLTGRKPKVKTNAVTKQQKLRTRIEKFVDTYVQKLRAGELPKPSSGDCWHCCMVTTEGKALGEMGDPSHLKEHIRDKYYVPSLIVRALETRPSSTMMRHAAGCHWYDELKQHKDMLLGQDFLWKEIRKCLLGYMLVNLGLPPN